MRARRQVAPVGLAVVGLLLGLAGVVSYFVVALRFGAWLPEVRNTGLPNWMVIGSGLVLSVVGVRHALRAPAGTRRRWVAPSLAALNVVVTAAFAWMMYGMSAVPPAAGPALGAPAPDFALVADDGRTVHLADFRGAPLLLVFYRGHW